MESGDDVLVEFGIGEGNLYVMVCVEEVAGFA